MKIKDLKKKKKNRRLLVIIYIHVEEFPIVNYFVSAMR